jgi:hypothetical protein
VTGVSVELGAGAIGVLGDAPLIRFALPSLVTCAKLALPGAARLARSLSAAPSRMARCA